jgi:hypothetical protein
MALMVALIERMDRVARRQVIPDDDSRAATPAATAWAITTQRSDLRRSTGEGLSRRRVDACGRWRKGPRRSMWRLRDMRILMRTVRPMG